MSADRTTFATVVLAALAGAAGACSHPAPVRPLPPLPRQASASYLTGKVLAYKGDWAAATEALAAAAAAAPDEAMIAVELARAQVKANRTDAALATLTEARRKWPLHPQVWLLSGDVLAAADHAQATRAYLEAIRLDPDDERAYLGLAKLQPPAAAEETLRILLRHVPGSIDGRYRLAGRIAARADYPAAIREFRAVLERDPDHIDARLEMSRALRRLGQLDQALVETRSAFDRSGQAIDIAEELFWLVCEADDRDAAVDLLTLLDDERSDADALILAARLDRGLGRLTEARAIATRIGRNHHDAGAIALARVELAAGDRAAVQATLATIPETSKLAPEGHRILAEAAPADADADHRDNLDSEDELPGALDNALIAAFALADLGKLAEAKAQLAPFEAARDPSDRTSAIFAHARLAQRVGDAAGALALLEPLIRAKPNLASALNLAGFLLADARQRLADAERYLRHARELAPGDPEILDSWGWLRLRQGHAREAVRVLDRAARFAPLAPEILVHLAAAWAADGAPRTAVATLDRAAALSPSPEVQKRIAQVRHTVAVLPSRP
jgi:tetratricopeptide (TPR) repeat protein